MSKIKIEIKNRWTGSVLFEYKKENNTIKDTIEKAVEREVNLRGAYLKGVNLEEANLGGTNLRGAYLEGANLRGANLEKAYLEGANLEKAYLEGANLREADLKRANLREAYLKGTYLEETYLEGTSLEGASLEGAYLYIENNEIDVKSTLEKFEEKNKIKIKEWYINKNIIPTRWNAFWKYGLIICNYEAIEEEPLELTIEQISKEKYNGREIKIIDKR